MLLWDISVFCCNVWVGLGPQMGCIKNGEARGAECTLRGLEEVTGARNLSNGLTEREEKVWVSGLGFPFLGSVLWRRASVCWLGCLGQVGEV